MGSSPTHVSRHHKHARQSTRGAPEGMDNPEFYKTKNLDRKLSARKLSSGGRGKKRASDDELQEQALQWIAAVTGKQSDCSSSNFHTVLKDGRVLCELANVIQAGSIGKVQ